MTDQELIQDFKQLDESINVIECYSTSDLIRHSQLEGELLKRGYSIRTHPKTEVVKEG